MAAQLGRVGAVILIGIVGVAQADIDTATKLRLQSIEARLPDVDRLERLEQRVARLGSGEGIQVAANETGDNGGASSGGMFSLLQDLQSVKEDVRSLRGEIDEVRNLIKRNEQRQRDLYEDLDARLQALEQGGGGSSGDFVTVPENGAGAGSGQGEVDSAEAEAAYTAALDLLKAGDYEQARSKFDRFVSDYPNSEFSDNAWYWLGEARYVDRIYEGAIAAFQRVIKRFPDSNKVPGAQYKLGVIYDEQGKAQQAREALQQVIQEYPDDNAAELARKHLDAMDR
ncbi:tol-pal system protein YbgF [Spectribacter hydrogenoxidans]|uniref:Cell division coordinator CpoB n=1 Tax=Spectribacter hydrogenoxidans TaxID=3075608 RepID=A0ABU3C2P5_9GAMM|nr:tol-pal system protein YbgF [Salinisphaera sp. W335]MDT0635661.1 tol-pal system protein YbgF [Salinisphaera sp. W335]